MHSWFLQPRFDATETLPSNVTVSLAAGSSSGLLFYCCFVFCFFLTHKSKSKPTSTPVHESAISATAKKKACVPKLWLRSFGVCKMESRENDFQVCCGLSSKGSDSVIRIVRWMNWNFRDTCWNYLLFSKKYIETQNSASLHGVSDVEKTVSVPKVCRKLW